MSGLGERATRLRRIAHQLNPAPVAPPFFVQLPDEVETRAIGWYMRRKRKEKPYYLGHSAIAAELELRRLLDGEGSRKLAKTA